MSIPVIKHFIFVMLQINSFFLYFLFIFVFVFIVSRLINFLCILTPYIYIIAVNTGEIRDIILYLVTLWIKHPRFTF